MVNGEWALRADPFLIAIHYSPFTPYPALLTRIYHSTSRRTCLGV